MDNLVNLRLLFRDAFVLHYVSPQALNDEIHRFDAAPPPKDVTAVSGLISKQYGIVDGEWLTCGDVKTTTYSDWTEALAAVRADPDAADSAVFEYVRTWGNWYTPVHAALSFTRTDSGNLASARLSVAALGEGVNYSDLVTADGKLSDQTVVGLEAAKGWNLAKLYAAQVRPLSITKTGETACDGFKIYNLEVK